MSVFDEDEDAGGAAAGAGKGGKRSAMDEIMAREREVRAPLHLRTSTSAPAPPHLHLRAAHMPAYLLAMAQFASRGRTAEVLSAFNYSCLFCASRPTCVHTCTPHVRGPASPCAAQAKARKLAGSAGPSGAGAGSGSSSARVDAWLMPGIVVKILAKELKDAGLYKAKVRPGLRRPCTHAHLCALTLLS